MSRAKSKMRERVNLGLVGKGSMGDGARVGGVFILECYDRDGNFKWRQTAHNDVVNEGLQHLIDTEFESGSQVTTWYVGLTGSSPSPAAGDTLASHGGWTEITDYDETNRQVWNSVRSGQTTTNSASPASFTMNASVTVGGAFICSAASGTSGTLMCVEAATEGNRSVVDDDVLNVTYSFTAADDGV